ncbi:MAG: META domain-containing protein [Acidobacteria bacterium]|nr:META domain-containing protein [Acidobacteriota bacterium]
MNHTYTKYGLQILVVIALAALGVCAQKSLGGVRWNLTEIDRKPVGETSAYIVVDPDKKTLGGSGGCNQLYGTVQSRGKKLKLAGLGSTKMFCTEGDVMGTEMRLMNALAKVARYAIADGVLTLYAGNTAVLKFRAAAPDKPETNQSGGLEDRKWILEKIASLPELPKVEPAPFIRFDKTKGSAGGDTSCNAFGGDYTTSGDRLKITGLISTMRACIEDERMNVEREFKSGLEKTDRYAIAGGKLMLYAGKTLLLVFRAG